MKKILSGGLAALLVGAPATLIAQETDETWMLTGSGSGAAPVSDRHDEAHGVGATGGLGVYRSLVPQFQLGARVDAGALPGDDVRTGDGVDQDTLGLGSLNGALRFRPLAESGDVERGTGFYLEAAAGPGFIEDDVRAFLAPGAGYIFAVNEIGIGPTARYLHVLMPEEETPAGDDVQIATFGIEVVLFDERKPTYEGPTLERPIPEPQERFEPAARTAPKKKLEDRDGDGIEDFEDACDLEPETYNAIDDHDGCPDSDKITLSGGNKVVVDEKTFFAYDEAELRPEGKQKLDEIVALYEKHGKAWQSLRVKGHADRRGPMPYNEDLSRRRAEAVKAYLTSKGVPADLLDIEAYGETRPAVPNASTEEEFQKNRRVEFEIVRD